MSDLLSKSLEQVIAERSAERRASDAAGEDGGEVRMQGGRSSGGKARGGGGGGARAAASAPYSASRPRSSPGEVSHNRIYAGNLSFRVTWRELKDHFVNAGFPSARADVAESGDGRSRGYGVVTLSSPAEAARAISELAETQLDGRAIFLRPDREASLTAPPREGAHAPHAPPFVRGGGYDPHAHHHAPHPPFYGGGGAPPPHGSPHFQGAAPVQYGRVIVEKRADRGQHHGSSDLPHAIHVSQIPFDITSEELGRIFADCGHVVHAEAAVGRDGRAFGWGIVAFSTPHAQARAIAEFDGAKVNDRVIGVRARVPL